MGVISQTGSQGVGSRLAEARKDAGLTLRGLADAAGLGHVAVDNIETDRHVPGIEIVERLSKALGVSPCWLAYGIGAKRARRPESRKGAPSKKTSE